MEGNGAVVETEANFSSANGQTIKNVSACATKKCEKNACTKNSINLKQHIPRRIHTT